MQLKMYSIRDVKTLVFKPPFVKHTHGEAERDFKSLVNDQQSMVNKYPEDFDLYYLGVYDDNSGKFEALDTPQHITKAVNVLDPVSRQVQN